MGALGENAVLVAILASGEKDTLSPGTIVGVCTTEKAPERPIVATPR
jgi:hypothetical protein